MFVLGIDPGLSRCGYGIVERVQRAEGMDSRSKGKGSQLVGIAAGVIETDPDSVLSERLWIVQRELRSLLGEFRPGVMVVERVFFQVNAKTAMSVGQASGLALAAAAEVGCPVIEYTSNEVKQALVGYGSASKEQVQRMVAKVLKLCDMPRPPDAADALALAICHLNTMPLRKSIESALSSNSRIGVVRSTTPP